MSYYYQREAGPEAQVITGEGDAPGVELAALVEAGPLPIRVALELVAYVADIVSIAEEDRAVHGDLGPAAVKVDSSGAVSVEGYGMTRRGGWAPEGKPVGVATDVYGMGALLVTALTGSSLGALPRDQDGHDEAIVQKVLAIDWKHLEGKRWKDDLVVFVSSMFAFSPEERPAPLDVANVLSQASTQVGGDDIMTWAVRAVRAAGGTQGRIATGTMLPQEDLGGPQSLGAPLSRTEAIRIRPAKSAKGESTAIWSRDRIAAMLAEEDEEEIKQIKVRKEWRPDESSRPMARPSEKIATTTRPSQASLPPRDPRPPEPPRPSLASLPPTPPRDLRPPPPPPPVYEPPPTYEPPPAYEPPPPVAQGPISSPFSSGQIAVNNPVDDMPPEEEEPKKSGMVKYVVIGLVALSVLCAGGSAVAYLLYQKFAVPETAEVPTPEPTPEPTEATPEPTPTAQIDTGKTRSTQGVEDAATPDTTKDAAATTTTATTTTTPTTTTKPTTSSATSKTSGSSSSGSSSKTSSSKTSSSKGSSTTSRPTTTAARGPYTVKFVAREGEATLQCGDGQQQTFVGTTRMSFSDLTTCRIKMGAALGVVQVSKNATFTCLADASNRVSCSEG